jgi:iron uptake system EfeUOB component EfeO/EfeM
MNFSLLGNFLSRAFNKLKPDLIACGVLLTFTVISICPGRLSAALLDEPVAFYRTEISKDIGEALAGAKSLRECLAQNDVACAKKAWIAARGGWERSEVFTGGLVPELDEKIDTWPKSTTGFHAIESKLFGAQRTDVMNETDALIADLSDLAAKIQTMPLPPQELLNGLARLAYEIGESKADGGESRVSGTSLDDMRNNVSGINEAYHTLFAKALSESDPKLAAKVQQEIEALDTLLKVPNLNTIDPDKLRETGEEFVVTLTDAAPKLSLQKPALEDPSK